MKVCFLGCEHSGTRWVTQNVARHPGITHFRHMSVPGGQTFEFGTSNRWMGSRNETFLLLDCIEKRNVDAVVIVYRDQNCVLESQRRGGGWKQLASNSVLNAKWGESWTPSYCVLADNIIDNWKRCSELVMEQCIKSEIDYVIVSYEAMIQSREYVLKSTFKQLGLSINKYPFYKKTIASCMCTYPTWWWDSPHKIEVDLKPHDGNKKYINPEENIKSENIHVSSEDELDWYLQQIPKGGNSILDFYEKGVKKKTHVCGDNEHNSKFSRKQQYYELKK